MQSWNELTGWPSGTFEDWLKLAQASNTEEELKKALTWTDEDDIQVNALYLPDPDLKPLNSTFPRTSFPTLVQWVWLKEESEMQRILEEALGGGAEALEFFGDFPSSPSFFSDLLSGYNPEKNPLWFDFGEGNSALLFILFDELGRHLLNPDSVRGGVNYDPLTAAAFSGKFDISETETLRTLRTVLQEGTSLLPAFHLLGLNGVSYYEAGASPALELALSLALADAYLEAVQPASPEEFWKKIHFRLAADTEFPVTLAKFLAFPVLWKNYCAALGIQADQPFTTAVLSRHWFSAFDVHNNLVRQTLQSVAATLGGCDALVAETYDVVKQPPTRRSYRLTRNIPLLLRYESDLAECQSLGSGSLFFQQYAGKMAQKAWQYFLEIQKTGGFLKALQNGFIQNLIQKKLQNRISRLNSLKAPVVGATRYANPQEELKALPLLPFRYPAPAGTTPFEPLQEYAMLRKLDEMRIKP
ncbi:MAG: methylmalonyl-CoA mutase family protein [Flavobacteriales bacterium]|nr:methylmalonyl-CoA mutase family protein [Flavobacteriales bacterium]